jgi:hypothetical protein
MALLSSTNLTLADWAKLFDPDGKLAVITNVLSQTNEILEDCVFKQANGKTHHRVTIATGLPAVYWRQINQGIPPSKQTTAQVDEGIGMLEARSETDCVLARLSGDVGKFRMSAALSHMESMGQTQARTMFYGNTTTQPASYLGLSDRFGVASGAANSQNVLLGGSLGGQTDNMSVWLVGWGDETVYCTFPEGSQAGLIHQNLGEQTVYGAGGVAANRMQAFVDLYQWHHGMVVQDWRYVVRIANLDAGDANTLGGFQSPTDLNNILHQMVKAVYRVPNLNMCRPAFYVNRLAHSALSRIAMEKSQTALALQSGLTQFGSPTNYLTCLGIPIRRCDTLAVNETRVV